MTRLFVAVAAVAVAIPALAQDTPAVKAAKELNGSYAIKSANFDNKPAPDEMLKDVTGVEIKDGTITVRTAKKDDPAKFAVDATKKPATIDITSGGDKVKPGLYKFEKGELTIAFSDRDARPTDFAPADGVRVLVLVKKDEPKKDEPKKDPKDK